jgi:AcrR family transcriptional regulator
VTPAAILRHVDSKQALFGQAMKSGMLLDPPACILELPHIDARTDPRIVLRRIAAEFVPFIQDVLATRIVVAMHAKARSTSVVLPFDPEADNPPRRGLKIVADYFRRAAEAGVMRIRDPHAAALLFMGSLQGYVLSHTVLKITPAVPLDQYVDALLDLWTSGAIRSGGIRGSKGKVTQTADRDRGDRARGGRDRAVHARVAEAEAGRPQRNARSADRGGRVAGGRTRKPRSDR